MDEQSRPGRLKLAHVIPSMNVGGRERVVLDILQYIDRRRFDVEVVCLGRPGTLEPDFAATGLPIHFLHKPAGFRPRIFRDLERLFVRQGYRIVHAHNPGAFLYAFAGAKKGRVPVLLNSEHGWGEALTRRKKWAESLLRRFTDATLAVSEDLNRRLHVPGVNRNGNILTLYNGICVERYGDRSAREPCRRELGTSPGDLLIGTVGRLAAVKDQATLVRGFARLKEALPQARLVIVGGGPLHARLEALIRELRLEGRAVLTGERHDIPALLQALDIFVLPSLSEGISITLLEAMAAGKPVIATAVGGNREIVADGVSGLLVPSGDPAALAAAAVRIATDPRLEETLAENALRRVQEAFDVRKMIRTLEALYVRLYHGRALPVTS